MKLTLLSILLVCIIVSCNNKKTEDNTAVSNQSVNINQVIGIGRIEPENEIIQLSPELGGIVQKIYKNENDSIKKGDTLIELKHTIEDANILQLKQAVAVQGAQIKVDKSAISELQIKYANSAIELKRLTNLLDKGAETQQVVDNANVEMQSFAANIKKFQATAEVSKMKWNETNTQVLVANAQRQQKFIIAPLNGILLELKIQTGSTIDSKQIVAQLKPDGKIIAVCEIDELFANKIKFGQSAVIRNFGALDTLTLGKIYFASSFLKKKSLFTDQPGEKEDRRVREIKILLDNPSTILLNSRIECVVFTSKNNP